MVVIILLNSMPENLAFLIKTLNSLVDIMGWDYLELKPNFKLLKV